MLENGTLNKLSEKQKLNIKSSKCKTFKTEKKQRGSIDHLKKHFVACKRKLTRQAKFNVFRKKGKGKLSQGMSKPDIILLKTTLTRST